MTKDYAIADYTDFEIHIKQTGSGNRKFKNQFALIDQRYAAKEKMADQGLLSEEAIAGFEKQKLAELAGIYAEHVIVGWKGKFKGAELPEFNTANVVKLLSDPKNDALFFDIIQFALNKANFEEAAQEEEIKN